MSESLTIYREGERFGTIGSMGEARVWVVRDDGSLDGGSEPTEAGIYEDRLGGIWRFYVDGSHERLNTDPPYMMMPAYAPFTRLVPASPDMRPSDAD